MVCMFVRVMKKGGDKFLPKPKILWAMSLLRWIIMVHHNSVTRFSKYKDG